MSILFRQFSENLQRNPGKSAFIIDDRSYSYSDLGKTTQALSAGLLVAGVAPGDSIGMVLGNGVEFALLMLAASRLGLLLVPVSPSLNVESIARAFKSGDVQHVIGATELLDELERYWSPAFKERRSVLIAADGHSVSNRYLSLARLFDDSNIVRLGLPALETIPDDAPFILTMTSGSTGDPKPILLSQKTKYLRAQAAQTLYGVTSNDVTLAATPMYHSLAMRLVLLPLITGGTAVLMPRFSARDWLDVVRRNGVTFSIAVSSQLKQILSAMQAAQASVDSLRCLVSSSALLDVSLKAELIEYLKCEFHECYGASEIAIATNLSPQAAAIKVDSVGTAIPGADVKILGEDSKILPVGEPGEIICKTTMLFSGYFKRPEATAAAMHGEYFRTGDVGVLDRDGYLKFLGRKKEIIITGGINVYPKDIEDVLLSHPTVLECAVVAVPDSGLGEAVAAVVVPRAGAEINIRELGRLCAKKLADYQQPRHFKVLSELPKNAMGKIMKRSLPELFLV